MSEQSFVIRKFFISLVSHTRSLFFKANQDANVWLKEVMNPLVRQIKEHKATMEKRLDTLRKISESRDTLEARIRELEEVLRDTRQQRRQLADIRDSISAQSPEYPVASENQANEHEAVV